MTITIPKGISTIFYDGIDTIDLAPYNNYINQVLEIHEEGRWLKLYNPEFLNVSDFNSLTPSLSYQFIAYSEFTITV